MPEEKAKLINQTAPDKKADAAKLPNAPPKTEKPPDQAASEKAAPTTAQKKTETPVKPPETPGKELPTTAKFPEKAVVGKAEPAADVKKPDLAAKPPDKPKGDKAAALPGAKESEVPAKTPDKGNAAKTTSPPAKAAEKSAVEKVSATPDPQKADTPQKPQAQPEAAKVTPTPEPQKQDTTAKPPEKGADSNADPVVEAKKSTTPVKPPDKPVARKPESATETKKQDTSVTPTLNKPVPPPAQKAEPSAKIMLGGKPHDPITPPKAADPPKEPGEQKGVRVTQIFEDRLDYPDEKALNSLPIPKEGEGFSMRLHPAYFYQFLDHPFSVNREVKDYIELYESIRDNGINEPIKARPREKGGLELISGHRRHDIASRLNYPVPVIIAQVDDDTARVEVVDGNLHRMDIPTSELARAAKMKMEALARKAGRRSKMEQLTSPEPKKRTDQIVAEDMGISRNQVNRLVKINDLVPELKQQVDDKKLPFNTAVELAYLKPDEQTKVVDVMKKEQIVPSMAQATALKEASRHADTMQKNLPSLAPAHKVDENKITSIIKPKKAPELKVTFTGAELKDFFPGEMPSVAEVKRVVFDALKIREEAYKRQAKRQAAKDAIKSPEH